MQRVGIMFGRSTQSNLSESSGEGAAQRHQEEGSQVADTRVSAVESHKLSHRGDRPGRHHCHRQLSSATGTFLSANQQESQVVAIRSGRFRIRHNRHRWAAVLGRVGWLRWRRAEAVDRADNREHSSAAGDTGNRLQLIGKYSVEDSPQATARQLQRQLGGGHAQDVEDSRRHQRKCFHQQGGV